MANRKYIPGTPEERALIRELLGHLDYILDTGTNHARPPFKKQKDRLTLYLRGQEHYEYREDFYAEINALFYSEAIAIPPPAKSKGAVTLDLAKLLEIKKNPEHWDKFINCICELALEIGSNRSLAENDMPEHTNGLPGPRPTKEYACARQRLEEKGVNFDFGKRDFVFADEKRGGKINAAMNFGIRSVRGNLPNDPMHFLDTCTEEAWNNIWKAAEQHLAGKTPDVTWQSLKTARAEMIDTFRKKYMESGELDEKGATRSAWKRFYDFAERSGVRVSIIKPDRER